MALLYKGGAQSLWRDSDVWSHPAGPGVRIQRGDGGDHDGSMVSWPAQCRLLFGFQGGSDP